jgi:hypothetical protein
MPTTDGTVEAVRTIDPPAEMLTELRRLGAAYRRTESRPARQARDAAIVKWREELGKGSLSLIAREAGVSRVQAGRIYKAHQAVEPGQPIPPTRRFYQ